MTVCHDPNPIRCGTSCRGGVRAFKSWVLAQVPSARDDGCFNCRNVRGSTTTLSLHADGRAVDVGFPGLDHPDGELLFAWCIHYAEAIGAQEIIWSGRIWSWSHPFVHAYTGASAHREHVHTGFCRRMADALSAALLNTLSHPLGGTVPSAPTAQEVAVGLPIQFSDQPGVLYALAGDTLHPVGSLAALTDLIRQGSVSGGIAGATHVDWPAARRAAFAKGVAIA